MEAVKILLVLCFMLECCYCWVNQYDKPVSYECHPGQVLTKIVSQHNNYREDRQWDFQCAYTAALTPKSSCKWTNKVNQYDKVMNFKCPKGGAITGLRSVHNNYYEDRIYDVKCCDVIKQPKSCSLTGYVNTYDGKMNHVIKPCKYLHGIYSVHSNYHEDRRHRFYECNLPE
ncbi:hypothetical protein SNE40_000209 [Patella caerulea]|uniref:Uncharacterized protein n=1 Tax=Patella caerulea TaxID=87958 RepID=A0AAN8KGH2_PATCE